MPRWVKHTLEDITRMDPRGYKACAAVLRPPPKMSGSEWAESGAIVLPEGTTSMPGPLSFERFPYWRPILDWCADRETEEIVVCCSAQHGKTNAVMSAAMRACATDPGPVLWLLPTDQMAEEFMRDRFRPTIRASPVLRSMIMRSGSQSADRTDGVQWTNGGYLNVSGVAASQKLKGKPVRFAALDEVDEMIRFNPELGDPRERARTRLRTYAGRSKLLLDSTPTSEEHGIWVAWLESQQWTWMARCPHCGELQQMLFPQVKWSRTDTGEHPEPEIVFRDRLAYYECIACEGHWDDAQRDAAVQAGEMVCLTPERTGAIKGVHLNTLTSPLVSLSATARAFLRAKENPGGMIQFRNEWLAEPSSQTVTSAKGDRTYLETLRESIEQEELPGVASVPEGVVGVFGGADVQGDHCWAVYLGVRAGGRVDVLWAGRRPSLASLEEDARREWLCKATGEVVPFVRGFVDSGYRTAEVYEFTRMTGGLWQAVKGGSGDEPVPISPRNVARGQGRNRVGGGDLVNILNVTHFKDEIDRLLGQGLLKLPRNAPDLYIKHLTSEVKKWVRTSTGGQKQRWVPRFSGAANHMLDGTAYAWAAVWSRGMQNIQATAAPPREATPINRMQELMAKPLPIQMAPNSLGFKPMQWGG